MTGASRPSLLPSDPSTPANSLPLALLTRSRARLATVALVASLFLFGSQVLASLWWLALGRDGVRLYRPGGDLLSASLCLVLFLLARSPRLDARTALRIGLVMEVILCGSLFFFEVANSEHGLSWGALVIALFPLLVPAPARVTLWTSIVAALTAVVAVVLAALLFERIGTERVANPWASLLSFVPQQIFAVFVAVAGSKALREASVDVLELQQHQRLVETILKHSGTAVALVDDAGAVAYLNEEAKRLLSATGEVRGKPMSLLFTDPNDALAAAWQASEDTTVSFRRGGELETLQLLRRPVHINHRNYTLWLARRLTGLLRTREVTSYKRLLRAFGHEINNSLGALASMLRSIKAAAERPDREHLVAPGFDRMEECVAHLGAFFERYVAFVRLPAPRIEEVSWEAFVQSLGEMVSVRVVGSLPPKPARFDAGQLRQVLVNLVKNAHESGSSTDDVTLTVTDEGSEIVVEVSDRGQGLSEEAQQLALTPFFSTKPEGTGLGLAISLEIIEAHGGRMHIAARDGGGTSVRFWLPH
jgi:two-component system, NtrC family, nitrogen regulation sensor histidine kinase NtrY